MSEAGSDLDLQPSPSEAVLLELGRMTWAAICLEDVVYALCRYVQPREVFNDTPVSTRASQAIKDLQSRREDDPVRLRAERWLNDALAALTGRNAVLHAEPIEFVPLPGTTPIPGVPSGWLAHFPRDRSAPAVHTPLTVDGLRPVTSRLELAREEWMEVATSLFATRTWGSGPESTPST